MKNTKPSTPAQTKTITVKVNEENPEPVELIAKSIIELSDGYRKIMSGHLKRHALVVLLKDATGISQRDIIKILEAVSDLKNMYTK